MPEDFKINTQILRGMVPSLKTSDLTLQQNSSRLFFKKALLLFCFRIAFKILIYLNVIYSILISSDVFFNIFISIFTPYKLLFTKGIDFKFALNKIS